MWSERLVSSSAMEGYVFVDNHFAGYGPGTVNALRPMLGMEELDWSDMLRDGAQTRLTPTD